jgi:hypothetical protein
MHAPAQDVSVFESTDATTGITVRQVHIRRASVHHTLALHTHALARSRSCEGKQVSCTRCPHTVVVQLHRHKMSLPQAIVGSAPCIATVTRRSIAKVTCYNVSAGCCVHSHIIYTSRAAHKHLTYTLRRRRHVEVTPADESESEVEIEEDVTVTYPTAVHDVSTVTRVSGACPAHAHGTVVQHWSYTTSIIDYDQLPDWAQDNDYIRTGHRRPLNDYLACLRTVFAIHTETGNIWTHMIGEWTGKPRINSSPSKWMVHLGHRQLLKRAAC